MEESGMGFIPGRRVLAGTLVVALLGGCGGGGSSTTSPPTTPSASILSIAATVKTLHLTWTAPATATRYQVYFDAHGSADFQPVGAEIAAPTTHLDVPVSVPLVDWRAGRYRVDACNADGCTTGTPLGIANAMLGSIGLVTASGGQGRDLYGSTIALSADGTTLVVGAAQDANPYPNIDGAVYVYVYAHGAWTQQAYLQSANPFEQKQFGASVAISADGNTIAIGAPGEWGGGHGIDPDPNDTTGLYTGAAYVYVRTVTVSGTSWDLQAYVKNSVDTPSQAFGTSVALSADGNLLAVGAPLDGLCGAGVSPTNCGPGLSQSGTVYAYRRSGTTWAPGPYFKASNAGPGDYFGQAVALSGDGHTLAVGAILENSGSGGVNGDQGDVSAPQSGAVYVFSDGSGHWLQQAYLKETHPHSQDAYGTALALSDDGNTLAAGAIGDASAASGVNGDSADTTMPVSGATYVYARTGASWQQQAYLKASSPDAFDRFGISVALTPDGSVLLIGANGESSSAVGVGGNAADNALPQSGAAYLFRRTGAQWAQSTYLKPAVGVVSGSFGVAGAISSTGDTLAIGAYGYASPNPGSVSVY
jgi:hypothetical protein